MSDYLSLKTMTSADIVTWDTVKIVDKPNPGFEGLDLLYAEFKNEEYIHFEVDQDGQAIMWSTDDDIATYLDKVRSIVGVPSSEDSLTSRIRLNDGTLIEDTPQTIEAEMLKRPEDIAMYEA